VLIFNRWFPVLLLLELYIWLDDRPIIKTSRANWQGCH
jgi:hypothetical protein